MPRDLFGDVTRPSISIGSRKWYTLPLSLLSHSLAVGSLIAVPILAPSIMPDVWKGGVMAYVIDVLPPPPPPPPPPPAPLVPRDSSDSPPPDPNAFPTIAPDGVTKEPDLPTFENDKPLGAGVVFGTLTDGPVEPIAPPPPAPVEPLRVGDKIRPPVKIRDAKPEYPAMAIAARIEGIVIIDATIGADGRVLDVQLLRPLPFLDQAALAAVRQWQFTPTLLNGVPVPVLMTVTVRFTLK